MLRIFAFLTIACYGVIEARPNGGVRRTGARATFDMGPMIIGGVDALPGEFPWQLSIERESGAGDWQHYCGASLLTHIYALSAAHCVDGASPTILRVWAGLHNRSDVSTGDMSAVESYAKHEEYGAAGQGLHANDIAILTLEIPINANGGNIEYLTLPVDNSNNYAGADCTITGWGRTTSASSEPSSTLQKAVIRVITTQECNLMLESVPGTTVTDNHLCAYDSAQLTGSCSGDYGGPMNCEGGAIVAGVSSWGIASDGVCLLSYPSVYIRTSAYLDWILANAP